jgi:hypothetical protein
MTEKKKYVLVEMGESDDVEQRLTLAGLKGVILGYESQEISAELFAAATDLREALSVLNSFCNSTSVNLSIPPVFIERADIALKKARQR